MTRNANAVDKEGSTPLYYAVTRANLGLVRSLLTNGADASLLKYSYVTAAYYTITDADIFRLLCDYGLRLSFDKLPNAKFIQIMRESLAARSQLIRSILPQQHIVDLVVSYQA